MSLALVIVAVILFVLQACNVPSGPVSLGWLGLAFWSASTIVGQVG